MLRRYVVAATLTAVLATLAGASAYGYVFFSGGARWFSNPVMHSQFGTSGTLEDGCPHWGECAERAMSIWNQHLSGVDLRAIRDSPSPIANANGINNMFWSANVYGDPFGTNTIAITLVWWRGTQMTDADVIFNNTRTWNSYRGPARSGVLDFQRVAVHELGHALGLDHPDDAGQSVAAIMNSRIGNIEVPQNDDIAGVRTLYAVSTPPPSPGPSQPPPLIVEFPPRDQSLGFRNELETKYRTGLSRSPLPSFADLEGSVVWTQEYLRYRVNLCAHSDAITRVLMQIDGQGIQPVCGIPRGSSVAFPPRNETHDFRLQLETKYRDGLRRGASTSAVDIEGDVVWIQEYLRYRVNRCNHPQAVDRVMLQIDGRGVQPTC